MHDIVAKPIHRIRRARADTGWRALVGSRRGRRIAIVGPALLVVALNLASAPSNEHSAPAGDAAIDAYLAGQLADAGIPGGAVAIVRDGAVTDVRGFGVADASGRKVSGTTPFVIGSLSKPLTALAVMQLVERGDIDLDAPVVRYLHDFHLADPVAAATITVRQLLDQTSGLPTSAGQRPLSGPVTSLTEQVRALAAVRPAAAPGAAFAYSNANYEILGSLVEQVSGQSFASYVGEHVFAPLAMDHAHVDLASAEADGLSDAHRLWFGLADDHRPLWRPDFLPAGWLVASAQDLAHLLVAELDGGTYDGTRVLSAAGIAATQRGLAAMGADAGRYGLGWVETRLGTVRVVAHTGSTTDMASAVAFAPDRRLGIVVLFNGQSTLYELFHKPDTIAMAALQQMLGEAPMGTLVAFYPAFDLAALLLLAYTGRKVWRTARRLRRGDRVAVTFLGSRWLGIGLAIWLDGLVPLAILTRLPDALVAPWWVLVRIDVGLVAMVFALMRLITGGLLAAAAVRPVLQWAERRAGREVPAVGSAR